MLNKGENHCECQIELGKMKIYLVGVKSSFECARLNGEVCSKCVVE